MEQDFVDFEQRRKAKSGLRALAVFFFFSGFSSLVYEVVWLRLAFAAFGVITPVVSVVLSVFMLGLALGSYLGAVQRRGSNSTRPALFLYGLTELWICLGGLIVPSLFAAGSAFLSHSTAELNSAAYLALSAGAILFALLPWCVAMGATFPIALRAIDELDEGRNGSFSMLYGANVIGAAIGALSSAFVFVELFGFHGTLLIAAAVNAVIGFSALAMSRRHSSATVTSPGPDRSADLSEPFESRHLLAILFVTGLMSLGMEVAWTRAFTRALSTTVYAFASILAVYLLGNYFGTVMYRWDLRRNKRISKERCCAWIAASGCVSIVLGDPRLGISAAQTLLSIVPVSVFLGYLTPSLLDDVARSVPRFVGKAYAVNIVGGIVGPLIAGYLLLPVLGVKWSLVILVLPILFFAVAGAIAKRTALVPMIFAALLCYCSVFAWNLEDSGYGAGRVIVRRDATATVVSLGEGFHRKLIVNGVGMTALNPVTKFMSHLPFWFLPRKPESALIICLGMGTTLRSSSSWGVRTQVAELVPSVRDAVGYYSPYAAALLHAPGNQIAIDDGRRFLRRTTQRYDMITLDPPPPPSSAATGLLYSVEFYELAKAHLTPGGILQVWFPSYDPRMQSAAVRSLESVFPHVKMFLDYSGGIGYHFLASVEPIQPQTAAQVIQKMPERAKQDLMEWYGGKELQAIVERMLSRELDPNKFLREPESDMITDDRPFNEYFKLRELRERWFPKN